MIIKTMFKWLARIGVTILTFLLCLLTFSLLWAESKYGNIGFEEIVFHLNMPLKGVASDILETYCLQALFPACAAFAGIILLIKVGYPLVKKAGYGFDIGYELECIVFGHDISKIIGKLTVITAITVIWLGAIVLKADRTFGFLQWINNQFTQSLLIENEYVDASEVKITFPETKRNLICIFVESGETSAQDIYNGGLFEENYIPELTKLAKENTSFSQSDKFEGASVAPGCGWTMAGLLAETSGVPLKMYGQDKAVDNSMGDYEYFLPGVTTLGDILETEGYHNYFMVGSDFSYGGREAYFTLHGNYEFEDYDTVIESGKLPSDYKVWWGFEDQKLFEYAKETITKLAKEKEPFNFSLLTVDTHHEDGYVCGLCPDKWDNQYANVWSCASYQINEFVDWIKEQDFYENTTIVVLGDHCSMDTDFYEDFTVDKHSGSTVRKIYNTFINSPASPVNEKNRLFTTMDFYPTTLASLGVQIEGDRLGLGTNLFSGEMTLAEKYGYEYLFEELEKKSQFYDYELLYP